MIRVGQGYDVHAFAPDRPLVIGGVTIPHTQGLAGHSDADVLSHAVADALLGAAALGDLGQHFPDDDRWSGASSLEILAETARMLEGAWTISNIDSTVVAEAPRLGPHRDVMRENIARALGVDVGVVSVKATSTDSIGFTGRREGIAAFAVAVIAAA